MKPAVLAALLASAALPCSAAKIEVRGNVVTIVGTIELNDDQIFQNKVEPYHGDMRVVLHSRGGTTHAALSIGRIIRKKGWNTEVPFVCQSSCAWLWLSGRKLFKAENAEVSFHSVSDKHTGQRMEWGNYGVKMYLNELGYSDEVAKYTTAGTPGELTVLSDKDAKRLGIKVTITRSTLPRSTR